jgi:hypothetical protein
MFRALIPPLTVALALVTAVALLLTAVTIVPPPLNEAAASLPLPSTAASPSSPTAAADISLPRANTALLIRSARAVLPPPPMVLDLARLTYAPGSDGTSRALPGLLLLAVEAGTLTVQLDGAGELTHADYTETVHGTLILNAGDGLALYPATSAAFRNNGAMPVLAFAAGIFPATAVQSGPVPAGPPQSQAQSARWPENALAGAVVHPLAGGWLVDPPPRSATVELRRLSLPPNGSMPMIAPGAAVLSVEAGALSLAAEQGLIWRQPPDGPDEWVAPASEATLLPNDAAILQEAARVTLRNAGSGPLLVLSLTIVRAEE